MAGIRAEFDVGISQRSKAKVHNELNAMFKRQSGRNAGFSINEKSFSQPLGRITASANEFTKSLEASNARVIAFGASVGVINAVTEAFKGLVMETLQFEKTLTDINVIMNASSSALRDFGDELFNVSRNTAQSFTVVAEAALEFSRQGLTMEETLRRTNDALILTRLTGLKATEAVAGLTAAVNAFAATGLTTTDIIDKLAAVDVNFAVSSEDLIHALERTGAVAISAGVELDNLVGLVTSLQQTTARGGAVIGNGLKTIFTRIQRPRALRQLEEMSIAVRDLTGAVLPADKILQNIAKTFNTLSQSQQSNVVQFSAGIFQANIFRATLADLAKQQNIFSKASDISADAAGNAAVKNMALNKTLAAMVSQTQSSVRELAGALGEIMLEDSLKSWTSGFKFLVDGLNNALDGGEGKGSDFAKGFFKGLGNVLTGPVAIAIGVVFIKLLANVAKFAGQSLKDVLGVSSEKEKMLKMENGIIEALSKNKHIQQSLNNLEGDRLAQEVYMLKIIEMQTNAMQEQKLLARALAKPLMQRGINPDLTTNAPGSGMPVDVDGDGQYDTFTAGGVVPQAVRKERSGAIKAGYVPGAVSSMKVQGLGTVIYNKAEKVKKFAGMKQPAIMPPESSRAGGKYRERFSSKHGFDPYVSMGLIPNFATISNNLNEGPGRMGLMGTGQFKAPDYIKKQVAGSPANEPIYLTFNSNASTLKNKNWKKNNDAKSLGELLTALGIDQIETVLPFDFVAGTTGPFRSLPKPVRDALSHPNNDTKGSHAESMFLASGKGEGYTSTGGLTPTDAQGGFSIERAIASPNANLDAYRAGDAPMEIKAGDLDLDGVLKKSIRRYSNEAFRSQITDIAAGFIGDKRPNAVLPGFSNGQVAEELISTVNHLEEEFIIERLSELAKNGNWSPAGMTKDQLQKLISTNKLREHMRGQGFQASDADKALLNSIGFSDGLVPNFYTPRKTANPDDANPNRDTLASMLNYTRGTGYRPTNAQINSFRADKGYAALNTGDSSLQGLNTGLLQRQGGHFTKLGLNTDRDNKTKWLGMAGSAAETRLLGEIGAIHTSLISLGAPGPPVKWTDQEIYDELVSRSAADTKGELSDVRGHRLDAVKESGRFSIDKVTNWRRNYDAHGINSTGSPFPLASPPPTPSSFAAGDFASVYPGGFFKNTGSKSPSPSGDKIASAVKSIIRGPRAQAWKGDHDDIRPMALAGRELANFKSTNFQANLRTFELHDGSGTKQNKAAILKAMSAAGKPGYTNEDWEDFIEDSGAWKGRTSHHSHPIDFKSPIADAKFGAPALAMSDSLLVGKRLRAKVMAGNYLGWNDKSNLAFSDKMGTPGTVNVGSLDIIDAMHDGLVPNFIGFSSPGDTVDELIKEFNGVVSQNSQVPTFDQALEGGAAQHKKIKDARAAGTYSSLPESERREYQVAQDLIHEIQMAQKQRMILLLKKMQAAGAGKLHFGQEGEIYSKPTPSSFPFTVDQIIGVINGAGMQPQSDGFVPNFREMTQVYRGQQSDIESIPMGDGQSYNKFTDSPLSTPNVNPDILEPFRLAKTPDDIIRLAQQFVGAHTSGAFSGRMQMGSTGDKDFSDIKRDMMAEAALGKNPYSVDVMRGYGEKMGIASGMPSWTTRRSKAEEFAGMDEAVIKDEGKVHEKLISTKQIWGKKKLSKWLNQKAKPPVYPNVDKFKTALFDGSMQQYADMVGGIFLNVAGDHTEGPKRGQYMSSIIPPADMTVGHRDMHPNRTEREVAQFMDGGLVPNFSWINRKKSSRHIQGVPDPNGKISIFNKETKGYDRYRQEKGGQWLEEWYRGLHGSKDAFEDFFLWGKGEQKVTGSTFSHLRDQFYGAVGEEEKDRVRYWQNDEAARTGNMGLYGRKGHFSAPLPGTKDLGLGLGYIKNTTIDPILKEYNSQYGHRNSYRDEKDIDMFDNPLSKKTGEIEAAVRNSAKESSSGGLIPNFAGESTKLYRGTSVKYQKAVADRPNAPQFLFDKILSAETKAGFLGAIEELLIQHAKGKYSGSYNNDSRAATLEEMREKPTVLSEGEVQHAGYVYKRPKKEGGGKYASDGTTLSSGFVSKTTDRSVADRFSRALEFTMPGSHSLKGQVHKDTVPNSRIFNKRKLEKYVDRFGLKNVQESFLRGMKNGTLKDIYMNLDTWKPEEEAWGPARSIGHSGEGMTFNEKEYTQIWNKHSPFYGNAKGLIPNFADVFHGTTMEGARGIIESGEVREGYPDSLSNRGLIDALINREGGVYWSPRRSFPGLDRPAAVFSTSVSGRTPVHNGETITDASGDLKINPETGYNLPLESQNKENFKYWENNYKNFIARLDDPEGWSHFSYPEVRIDKPFVKDPKLVRPSREDIMSSVIGTAGNRGRLPGHRLRSGGLVPNFVTWHDRPGGGSKVPSPDSPGLFTKEEVDEIKERGYKRTDHHGWHYAEPVGLKHTPPTTVSPFGLAGPVSFDFLSRMIAHDREIYSVPNREKDNANLDELGRSLISKGQKDAVIMGYDSTVNRMQLIEGNHRVAALSRLNRDRDKTQKFYTGIHGYVSGAKLRPARDRNMEAGFVNQQITPPGIPKSILEAMKDPYRREGDHVQGSWSPSEFDIPNFAKSFTLGMGNFKPEEMAENNRAEYIKQLRERMKWWTIRASESGSLRFKGYADDLLAEISDVQSGSDFMSLAHRKKHKMAASSGLVPNFVDINKVRTMAQRGGTEGERAAAQNILKGRIISSKSMWDKGVLESFLKDPNQEYPPGTDIMDYLIGKGYDPDQLARAARDPKGYQVASNGMIPNFVKGIPDDSGAMRGAINKMAHIKHMSPHIGAVTRYFDRLAKESWNILTASLRKSDSSLGEKVTKAKRSNTGPAGQWESDSLESVLRQEVGYGKGRDPEVGFPGYYGDRNQPYGKNFKETKSIKSIFDKHGYEISDFNYGVLKQKGFDDSDISQIMDSYLSVMKGLRTDPVSAYQRIADGKSVTGGAAQDAGIARIKENKHGASVMAAFRQAQNLIDMGEFDHYGSGMVPNFADEDRVERTRRALADRVRGMNIPTKDHQSMREWIEWYRDNVYASSVKYNSRTMHLSEAPNEDIRHLINTIASSRNIEDAKAAGHFVSAPRFATVKAHTSEMIAAKVFKKKGLGETTTKRRVLSGYGKGDPDSFLEAVYGGMVPNFGNALQDAINREKAAGVPGSRIRVEKSSQLMGPQNPMGLAVTNTRDEPSGVNQGIRRSRAMGIDPKKHGIQLPNFAASQADLDIAAKELEEIITEQFNNLINNVIDKANQLTDKTKEVQALPSTGVKLDDLTALTEKSTDLGKGAKDTQADRDEMQSTIATKKIEAKQAINALEKSPTGDHAKDAKQIEALNKLIDGLDSLNESVESFGAEWGNDTGELVNALVMDADSQVKKSGDQWGGKEADYSKEGIASDQFQDMFEQQRKGDVDTAMGDPGAVNKRFDAARADEQEKLKAYKELDLPDRKGSNEEKELKAARERTAALQRATSALSEEADAREGGLQRLFYFQSMLSMANGFLEQFSENGNETIKTMANVGLALSKTGAAFVQAKELGSEAMQFAGVDASEAFGAIGGARARDDADEEARSAVAAGTSDSRIDRMRFSQGGRFSALQRGIGGAARGFSRMIPILGQAYAGFTALDQGVKALSKSEWGRDVLSGFGLEVEKGEGIMSLFKTEAEKAETQIGKLGKAAEATSKALEGLEKSEQNLLKLTELEAMGGKRTISQEREMHKLKSEEYKLTAALQMARNELTDADVMGTESANLMRTQLDGINMTGKNTEHILRSLNTTLQRNIMLEQQRKNFDETAEDKFDFTNWEAISMLVAAPITAAAAIFAAPVVATAAGATSLATAITASTATIVTATGAVALGGVNTYAANEALNRENAYDLRWGQTSADVDDMVSTMGGEGLAHSEVMLQGLYGGDTNEDGSSRSETQKLEDLAHNQSVMRRAMMVTADQGPEAIMNILGGLKASKGAGEIDKAKLVSEISSRIRTASDLQDNPGTGNLAAEHLATVGQEGYIGQFLVGMSRGQNQLTDSKRKREQIEIDMKNIEIQKRIFRNHQLFIAQQKHQLSFRSKALSIESDMQGIREDLLGEYGLILNATKIESEAARKSAMAAAKNKEKKLEIRENVNQELNKFVDEASKLENVASIFKIQSYEDVAGGKTAGQQALDARVNQAREVGRGRATDSYVPTEVAGEIKEGLNDAGMKDVNINDLTKKANEFITKYAKSIENMDDVGEASALFEKQILRVNDVVEKYAILMTAEAAGLANSGDNGQMLQKVVVALAKFRRETESAGQAYNGELEKNAEELKNNRIKGRTVLGAGLFAQKIKDEKHIEKQPGLMESTFAGDAAQSGVENKLNKERLNILLKSKNFELSILAGLQSEAMKASEDDVKSLKMAEFKNKIFASNEHLLTSAVSKVLLEQEDLEISNKGKEIKLAVLSNSEKMESLSEAQVRSEMLDAEISARTLEGKRKILENVGYARMLAEAQVKAELESAKISAISAEHKLIAQVANGGIAELVKAELESRLSSTRTEALKASESALQLQLNKEQTKKMQKANELLDLSNQFTAMKNAEMAANKSQSAVRMGNIMAKQTNESNLIGGARSAIDMAAYTGHADDKLSAANQISDTERAITGKSGALTALAQKMAEVEVAASSLSADLGGLFFDGVRSGFGQLLKDISTGAEESGKAWEKFGLGIAQQLLDRVMQHNIDKMMSNLTYAFTGANNDPDAQNKLLISATSKQTTATVALTRALEGKREKLVGDVASKDKGRDGFPLASIDRGGVTSIMKKLSSGMSSAGTSAGEAATKLDQLVASSGRVAEWFNSLLSPEARKAASEMSSTDLLKADKESLKVKLDQNRVDKNLTSKGIAAKRASLTDIDKEIAAKKKDIDNARTGADPQKVAYTRLAEHYASSKGLGKTDVTYEGIRMKIAEDLDRLTPGGKKMMPSDSPYAESSQNQILAAKTFKNIEDYGGSIETNWKEQLYLEPGDMTWYDTSKPMEGTQMTPANLHTYETVKMRGQQEGGNLVRVRNDEDAVFRGRSGKQNQLLSQDIDWDDKPDEDIYAVTGMTKDEMANLTSKIDDIEGKMAELGTLEDSKASAKHSLGLEEQDLIDLKGKTADIKTAIDGCITEINKHAGAYGAATQKLTILANQLQAVTGIDPTVPLNPSTNFFGGQIQNFHDGGFVRGEPGQDKVPAMLTAGEYVIPKDVMQGFNEGTDEDGASENRVLAGLKGGAQAVTMALVAEGLQDAINGEEEDKPPTFDMKKLNSMNIGSDVNLTHGDPRMSARALAEDPRLKEYKDYLLKKASYEVQKKNEKFQERMGLLGTVVGAINSFAIAQTTELLKEPINDLVTKGDNFVRGKLGLGGNSDEYNELGDLKKDINYKDIVAKKGEPTFATYQKEVSIKTATGKTKRGFETYRSDYTQPEHLWDKPDGVGEWGEPYKLEERAMGGQIPAMLTAGEAYVPAEMAKKIGYDSLNRMNKEGIVKGPGGIDNVGPVGLNPGDFIIRKSSTDKLLNANPNGLRDSLMGGGFTRRATQGYYDGGMAGDSLTVPAQALTPRQSSFDTSVSSVRGGEASPEVGSSTSKSSSATTNNINVSVKIDGAGRETVEGSTGGEESYQREKDLSMKIKGAVLEVIRQEKRVGGELS